MLHQNHSSFLVIGMYLNFGGLTVESSISVILRCDV